MTNVLTYGRVEGNFTEWVLDGYEGPINGRVVFTPTVDQVRIPGRMVHIRQVVARIVNGVLRPDAESTQTYVELLATNQTDAAPERFQWRAHIDLSGVPTRRDPRAVVFNLDAGSTVFLHAVLPVRPDPAVERVYELGRGERGPQGIQGIQGVKGDQGIQGVQGPSGTISGATATGLAEGAQPTVTLGGTAQNRTFAFGIPRGNTGAQGIQGIQGIQGVKGDKGDKGDIGPVGPQGEGVKVFLIPNSMWPPAPDPDPLNWYVRIADPA